MIEEQIQEVNGGAIDDRVLELIDTENILPFVGGTIVNNSKKRDSELMNMLIACERYVLKQRELGQELSKGFFRLAQSRRNRGSHVYSVDDVRFEIEPELCLHDAGEFGQVLGHYESEIEPLELSGDCLGSIYLLSAMPPPPLRTAQMHFRKTLELSAELAREIEAIQRAIETCMFSELDE
eukprot:gene27775-36602_t